MSIIYYALLVFMYITPWFQGSTAKLGIAITAAFVGSLILLQELLRRNAADAGLYNKFSLCVVAYSGCILIGLLQCVPGVSFGEAATLYAEAGLALHHPITPYLSVSPEDTVFGVVQLLTYGAVFWIGLNAGVDYKRALRLLTIMACIAGAYAVGSLYQHDVLAVEAAQLNRPFWAPQNVMAMVRNHFAVFMGMHIIIACALLWQSMESFKEDAWQDMNRLLLRLLPLLALLPLLGIALILTASRAGIASSVIGIIALFAVLVFSRSRARWWAAGFSVSVIALLALLFGMGGTEVFERYAQMGPELARRLVIQRDTLDAISFFPVTGSGLYTFPQIIKSYLTESFLGLFMDKNILIDHAFNSYEETMLAMGIPAFFLLMAAILYIGFYCLRGAFTRMRHAPLPAAAFAIGVVVACHSFVDYSMQVPTIALLVCFTFGIGAARAFPADTSK